MLAPGVRVERVRALRARQDGQENNSPPIFEKLEQEVPASSIILLHASGFDAWPRFPRPLPFPMSSASSPTLVSAVVFSAFPV